jgi:TIGR03009 family protein
MRTFGLTFAVLFVAAFSSLAQNAPAPPMSQESVDQVLEKWQKRMLGLDSFTAEVTLTETQPLTQKKTSYMGKLAFKQPNLAFIDLTHADEVGKKDAEKTDFRRIYCDGKSIFTYSPAQKLLFQHTLPQAADDNMVLAFLRGLPAEKIRKHFDVTATYPKDNDWYVNLDFKPKLAADKQDFDFARVALRIKNAEAETSDQRMLPSMLWYREPNGKVLDYRLTKIQPNVRLDADTFKPRLIEGYKEVPASAPQSPALPR